MPPDPALQIAQMKAQTQQQIEGMKLQMQAQLETQKLEQQAALERQRMQMQAEVDTNRQRAEAEQQAMKIRNEADLAAMRAQYEDLAHQREQSRRWDEAQLTAATKIQVATVMSKDKVADPATAAATNEIATEVTQ
jgi:hypothetical protein